MTSLDVLVQHLEVSDAGPRPLGQEDQAWNILVQVLLPLVIMLTFVIITSVYAYRSAYDALKDMTDKDDRLVGVELRDTVIELQLQKLLKALEEIKTTERTTLGVVLFPTSGRVRKESIRITDEDFQALCHRASTLFGNSGLLGYADELYRRVLTLAHVKDTSRIKVQRWGAETMTGDPMLKVADNQRAFDGHIVQENRRTMHGLILDFIDGLKADVINLQTGLVKLIFDDILASGGTKELSEKPIVPPPGIFDADMPQETRQKLAEQFYQGLVDRLHEQLERGGYPFLAESWKQIRS